MCATFSSAKRLVARIRSSSGLQRPSVLAKATLESPADSIGCVSDPCKDHVDQIDRFVTTEARESRLQSPTGSSQSSDPDRFEYGEAIHTERHIRIVVVGAGPSGLLFAYKMQRSFRNFALTLYDKNSEVSGTWFENQYPGCASDIPSHNYTYTFEPKENWSSVFASAREIKEYFVGFKDKYELGKYIRLQHQVIGARWVDDADEWVVTVKDMASGASFDHTCDIFINAGGYLNEPTFPNIPGLKTFEGEILHSASWDHNFSSKGKRLALLGNGASGMQLLPALQPISENITFFMRSPAWILPPIGSGQHEYTQDELNRLRDPKNLTALRKTNEGVVNSYFGLYYQNSPLQKAMTDAYAANMKSYMPANLSPHDFVPSSGIGCRSLTAGPEYLSALSATNVTVIPHGVTSVTSTGCNDATRAHHVVDVIVCATGFNTSYLPRFPIFGFDGLDMGQYWSKSTGTTTATPESQPRSYLGIAADGFPNFFTLLGPYSPIANGPTIPGLEAQVDHVLKLIDRLQCEKNIRYLVPKREAVDDFLAHQRKFMEKTVWMHGCRSSYKQGTSDSVPLVWPGSTLHCREALREVRGDDWEVMYNKVEGKGRFAWMGNGISQTEMDPVSDLGWYLTERDESELLGRAKRRENETRSGKDGVPRRELFSVLSQARRPEG